MHEMSILALGDPVMDLLAHVSHDFLATVTDEPGGCFTVAPDEMKNLLEKVGKKSDVIRIPGGSAANVAKGLASVLADRASVRFLGMIGRDSTGKDYRLKLKEQHVHPMLLEASSDSPSAVSLCMVTPDGQRTMRTCLGASLELKEASQAPHGWSNGLRLLHCEGYCLYRPQLAKDMMQAAKSQGAQVSMDLASFELVRHCKSSLLDLLESGCLDIVFANEHEAAELALQLHLVPASASHEEQVEAAQTLLLKWCQLSVVSKGPKGCAARNASGETASAPAAGVKVVDTVGAGDFFTAGFLSAYLQAAPLQTCAEAGCAAGSEAVQASGAELSPAALIRLTTKISALLSKSVPSQVPCAKKTFKAWLTNIVSISNQQPGCRNRKVVGRQVALLSTLPLLVAGIGLVFHKIARR
ncbi:hypothetical protein CEUSTIGMA_g5006.t1 [Chlamydomonas eustigma]|uniref:Carbohydrate kinase PfkB domain-containing protein n=1 Tax=Chlamydomonas eustigma TaxID=1157962 RepID=A0A250X3U1_9CHLO|nr:hypothetical protein CEUSTIGMA_g5006.t1 [Chlamydomonas eustigma]|eukprot:GAX77562.1 hypothetical protein CEUSTIGMA_g5006.t1 [Chlamydomonas eustigma]